MYHHDFPTPSRAEQITPLIVALCIRLMPSSVTATPIRYESHFALIAIWCSVTQPHFMGMTNFFIMLKLAVLVQKFNRPMDETWKFGKIIFPIK